MLTITGESSRFCLAADRRARWARRPRPPHPAAADPGAPLQRHLITVQALHEEDMADGYGDVSLPYAFARTYPNAEQAWV